MATHDEHIKLRESFNKLLKTLQRLKVACWLSRNVKTGTLSPPKVLQVITVETN